MSILINESSILPCGAIMSGHDFEVHMAIMDNYEDDTKIVSQRICRHFGDRIKYEKMLTSYFMLEPKEGSDNLELQHFHASPSVFNFGKFEDVLSHLEDERYISYFCKCVMNHKLYGTAYKLYVYMIDNVANLRERKLDDLGI